MSHLVLAGPLLTAMALSGARAPGARMQAGSSVSFAKYHGLGNDFVLVDCRKEGEPVMSPDQAQRMCDRNFGAASTAPRHTPLE